MNHVCFEYSLYYMVIMVPAPTSAHPPIRQVCRCMESPWFGEQHLVDLQPKQTHNFSKQPWGVAKRPLKVILVSLDPFGLEINQVLFPKSMISRAAAHVPNRRLCRSWGRHHNYVCVYVYIYIFVCVVVFVLFFVFDN